ncbi:SsrA-binding protein SmpB [bacterium]|nr:SsrA-binding protein SmpB [bacterium]
MKQKKHNTFTIKNRKAYHNYHVVETLECGLSLKGNEVKSIASGMCNMNDAWCSVDDGQLILHNMYVAKYETTNSFDADTRRNRVLLAHKNEIRKLAQEAKKQGFTIIPLEIYWQRQYCKIKIALCKGKHNYDKRYSAKLQTMKRDADKASKSFNT